MRLIKRPKSGSWKTGSGVGRLPAKMTLTLGGTNNGHNGLSGALKNHATANNVNQIRTGLTKTGTGTWWIDATNAGYTGNTTITDGTLVAATETGINGGFIGWQEVLIHFDAAHVNGVVITSSFPSSIQGKMLDTGHYSGIF